MGRTPKPTVVHMLQGTVASRHSGAAFQPIPAESLGAPPEYWRADGVERREWDYAFASCPAGMLRAPDRRLLIAWCECCAEYDRLREVIAKEGTLATTPRGVTASHPAVGQRDRALSRMKMLSELLGFSPAARTRLQVRDMAPAAGSEWEKLRAKTSAPDKTG